MDRRRCLQFISGVGMWSMAPEMNLMTQNILSRKIPSTGEVIPAIGLGTWQKFNVSAEEEKNPLEDVLKVLVAKGGTVIDSSPMYGKSEEVVGDLSTSLKLNQKLFIATKVWTNGKDDGINQMNDSFRLLRRDKIDLMQIHNLTDWETHLKTLKDWKDEGKIRYIGLTHYLDSVHEKLAGIIAKEKVDFIQINYNLLNRHAEEKLLPAARDNGVAVLVNRPFEEGTLFQKTKGKKIPEWAKDFDCESWGQFFLKFILSNPAVTCVIPGTNKPHHMLDNIGAGWGRLPDQKQKDNMVKFIST